MIIDQDNTPGDSRTWSPRFIPPDCPPSCLRGCDALYGIIVWEMTNLHQQSFIPTEETPISTQAAWVVHATEYYFDRYGCRRLGPPPRRDSVSTLLFDQFLRPGQQSQGIRWAWRQTISDWDDKDVPRPGTIRLLPKWRHVMTTLSLASPL